MAEERLIDEDKDKKYKIRKNADGEDELYIDETPEEEKEEVIDFFYADEEEELMTPEQIAERDRLLQAEKERIELKLSVFLDRAEELLKSGDYAGAETSLTQAEDLSPTSGKMYVLKCRVLTKDFSDFSRLEEAQAAALKVELFATKADKAETLPKLGLVKKNLDEATLIKEEREAKNEAQKAKRREVLQAEHKRATINFTIVAAVTVVFVALMGYFLSIRNASLDGTFLYLGIGFAVAAGVSFVAWIVFTKMLWAAARKCKLNERNSASKLGREFEEAKALFNGYNAIYTAFTVTAEDNSVAQVAPNDGEITEADKDKESQ